MNQSIKPDIKIYRSTDQKKSLIIETESNYLNLSLHTISKNENSINSYNKNLFKSNMISKHRIKSCSDISYKSTKISHHHFHHPS